MHVQEYLPQLAVAVFAGPQVEFVSTNFSLLCIPLPSTGEKTPSRIHGFFGHIRSGLTEPPVTILQG